MLALWQILFYFWIVSEILIAVLTRTRRSEGSASIQDRSSMLFLWLAITSSITACQWIAATHAPNLPHILKAAAIAVIILGLAIRLTAVFSLGKAFSANVAIRESQQLNQSGLYAVVRHPSYLGLVLIFLAIGLHTCQWLACACAIIPTTAALLYRIRVEEIALHQAFGAEYTAYATRTKRLIPGLI